MNHVGLVYVDAENCKTPPQDLMSTITIHNESKPSETYAYSKWSAKSMQTKKYRSAGFRLLQADSGDNNADIMMCLDAYQRVRDLSDNGISGNVYICFHGDKGFTHLLEKLRAIKGWNSVWVTSNIKPNSMIENSASVTLRVSVPKKEPIKKSPVNQKDTTISDSVKKDTGNDTELKELMLELIGEEEIKSSLFAAKILEYQKSNGWSETGKQAFNEKFGIAKSKSYLATISKHLSTEVEILGKGGSASYKRKVSSQSPKKEAIKKSPVNQKDTTIADSGEKFERIIGFNTSGKGLRFPLNPKTLANILLFNSEFDEEISKKERADVISEKLGVSRTRVVVVLTRLSSINLMKTESSLEAVKGLSQRFESSYNELGDWSPEEVEKIQQYFARAQKNLE